MFVKRMNFDDSSNLLSKILVLLLLCFTTRPVSAIEAQKPDTSLAERILLEKQIHREQFYGNVKLLHSPFPIDVQFSADGSVLFSLAETIRLWRSDTGAYLGSIAGPAKFSRFAQLNNSRWILTIDYINTDDHGRYYGVPQNLPNLRVWDVITGKCLTVRRLEIPVNAIKLWIPTLITVEENQIAYLILNYDEDRSVPDDLSSWDSGHYQLLGFQGRNLIPACKFEFEDPIEDLFWASKTRKLHVYSESDVSGFDPVSKKILWKKRPPNLAKPTKPVEELIVIDQSVDFKNGIFRLRQNSTDHRWYIFDDLIAGDEKMIWSKTANRVCYINVESEEINLFNAKTKKRVAPATGMVNALSSISANNFSGSFDYNDVFVFQFKVRDHIHRTFSTKVPKNSCVAISTDATTLLAGELSGKAYVWDLSNRKKLFALTGVSKKLLCIAADTAQKRFVAGDINGDFWRWNFPTQSKATPKKVQTLIAERNVKQIKSRLPHRLSNEELTDTLCALSPDGSCSLHFQPFTEEEVSPVFPRVDGQESFPNPGFSLVVNLVYERKYGEVIATENAKKQTILTPASGINDVLIQIKSSTNGRFALLVFSTGQVTIVDLQTGTLESIIQTNDKEIVDIDYHPDQKTLLVASYRGAVTAWNSETYLKTGAMKLLDARLDSLRSRVSDKGFDIVLGTRDTGLIIKWSVFPKSE